MERYLNRSREHRRNINNSQSHGGSLERGELGGAGGTHTDFTVANGLVGHGELAEVVADHVGSQFDGVPVFASVDFGDAAHHLGNHDAVTQVSLHGLGLFAIRSLLDSFLKFLDESVILGRDAVSEAAALLGLHELDKLVHLELQELLDLESAVQGLLEGSLLGGGGGRGLTFFAGHL